MKSKDKFKKADQAIEITSKTKITFLERKVFNAFVFHALNNLPAKDNYKISRKELCSFAGFDSKDDVTLKETLKALATTGVTWGRGRGKAQRWGVSSLIADAELTRGTVEFSFSKKLRDKLLNPEIYTLLTIAIQQEFTTGYALALYENLKRYQGTGSTGWKKVKEWRDLLGATSEYYDDYRKFNAKVLKPSIKQINKHSDIHAEVEPLRKGRKVIELKFTIKENEQFPLYSFSGEPTSPVPVAELKREAVSCYRKQHNGYCGGRWNNYKDRKDHTCHYCPKFKSVREAETAQTPAK